MLSAYQKQKAIFVFQHPLQYKNLLKLNRTNGDYSIAGFHQTHSIFVHIPKAAGVSVAQELYGNLAGGHRSIQEYRYLFSETLFNRYFKFAFVRNPWDRLFSAWQFLENGGFSEKDAAWFAAHLAKYKTFEGFVMEWLNESNMKCYDHFKSQADMLTLHDSNKLELDYLGYFENLEQDFLYVKERVRPEAVLRHLNKTDSHHAKKTYVEFYTDQMIEKVSRLYKKDIELFGYNFLNADFEKQLDWRDKTFSCFTQAQK